MCNCPENAECIEDLCPKCKREYEVFLETQNTLMELSESNLSEVEGD